MAQSTKEISCRAKSYIQSKLFFMDLAKVAIGSLCLSLLALAKVPLEPVPITLQTLGVFLIGLTMRPALAASAVALYLIEATFAMPILSGMEVNPLWAFGPKGGFLLSFVPASFLISYLNSKVKKQSVIKTALCILPAQGLIYVIGVSWLSMFFGLKKAVLFGVLPFLPGMCYKVALAALCYKPLAWLRNRF